LQFVEQKRLGKNEVDVSKMNVAPYELEQSDIFERSKSGAKRRYGVFLQARSARFAIRVGSTFAWFGINSSANNISHR
jgi:hypothetical protein